MYNQWWFHFCFTFNEMQNIAWKNWMLLSVRLNLGVANCWQFSLHNKPGLRNPFHSIHRILRCKHKQVYIISWKCRINNNTESYFCYTTTHENDLHVLSSRSRVGHFYHCKDAYLIPWGSYNLCGTHSILE